MANRIINCASCNRSVKKATLIVIGDKAFCGRCLKRIHVKGREITGWYYIHLKDRIFVEYWERCDRVVEEFRIEDIIIGGANENSSENFADVWGFNGLDQLHKESVSKKKLETAF